MIKLYDETTGGEMEVNTEIALSLLRDVYSAKAYQYLYQIKQFGVTVNVHGGALKHA